MRIDSKLKLLLPHEAEAMKKIADRLRAQYGKPPLPSGYQRAIDECFGGCGSDAGDLSQRGKR